VDVDSKPHLVEIVAALKEITARITSATALPEAIDDLLKVTADILPGHVQCGVTLISEGEPATFAATGLAPEVLDEAKHAELPHRRLELLPGVKTLDRLDVERTGEEVRISASARSFLHTQVRSMVGALAFVGEGRWTADDLSAALAARDRSACAPVAPPEGLYLVRVDY